MLNNELTYPECRLRGIAALKGLALFSIICSLGVLSNLGVANWVFVARAVVTHVRAGCPLRKTARAGCASGRLADHAGARAGSRRSRQCRFPETARSYSDRLRMFSSSCMSVAQ